MSARLIAAVVRFFRAEVTDYTDKPLPLYLRELRGDTKRLPERASTCSLCGALYIPTTTESGDSFRCGSRKCGERAERLTDEKVTPFNQRKLARRGK